jgi:hypothetical protein
MGGGDGYGDFTQGSAKTAWRNHWALDHNLFEIEDENAIGQFYSP